jgi:hypothetical protein
MAHKSWKGQSKLDYWTEGLESEGLPREQVQTGAIMRIADAVELMAKNHGQLIEERDRYKRWYEEARERAMKYRHSIAGLRGALGRAQRRAAKAN